MKYQLEMVSNAKFMIHHGKLDDDGQCAICAESFVSLEMFVAHLLFYLGL